jgi:hypothetical protein
MAADDLSSARGRRFRPYDALTYEVFNMRELNVLKSISTDSAEPEQAADPFDLANLRLDQSFVEAAGVKKLLTTVPVRRPNPQDWVRVHPSPEYREAALALIELKEDRETYLLTPPIAKQLTDECVRATIYTTINRQGVVHLWPVKLPREDSRGSRRVNEWYRSSQEAAELAMQQWVRVKANMSLGAYEIFKSQGASVIPDPEWPTLTFNELLRIAFRDRLVNSFDHPVIERLRSA